MIHGDVFRSPKRGHVLAPMIASGIQFGSSLFISLLLSSLGSFGYSQSGSLITFSLVLFILCGILSGYYGTRFFKVFRGRSWRRNSFFCVSSIPALIICIVLGANFYYIQENSTRAIPFGTLLGLFSLWAFLALPLSFLGSYFGFKKQVS